MSCELLPAIPLHNAGQRIPCLDRCQVIIIWTSSIREIHALHTDGAREI